MTDLKLMEQTALDYINKMIVPSDPLMPLWNRENHIFRKQPKWNYMDSCVIRAILMFDRERYGGYAEKFLKSYVEEDGSIPTYNEADFNLDNICGGMNLLTIHEMTGNARYISAAERLFRQLENQPRLKCGCFWHKKIYPRQTWLDGVYMALPFLAAYGIKKGDKQAVSDALHQVSQIRRFMEDGSSGLYFHGFDETSEMCWADAGTGLSREIWLRSNGWLCAGLADLYELTGDSLCGRMLRDLTDGLTACLTSEGMLLQLPMRPELPGNYPETSGTLLYAYGVIKGGRLDVVSESAVNGGKSAVLSVCRDYIRYEEGVPVMKNICLMAGLGGSQNRDGSAEYYLSEQVVENDAKGIAPYIMAVSELLKYCDY
ncbi:MAG: glycoside hydrolase family 88 protein [Alistipes sp.]|nr:glycoside hydrolase family 88 protein [Alistipes sp.]